MMYEKLFPFMNHSAAALTFAYYFLKLHLHHISKMKNSKEVTKQ
jgi:hypothetical protein